MDSMAAIAFPPWHNLRFEIDTTAYFGTNLGSPQHPYFIQGGAQYTWRMRREAVFVEGLGGPAARTKLGGRRHTWPNRIVCIPCRRRPGHSAHAAHGLFA